MASKYLTGPYYGDGDRQPEVIIVFTLTTALAAVAVILRFVSRRISKSRLWLDDWLMLAALGITLSFFALVMFWVSVGLGKDMGVVTYANLAENYKIIFALEMIYIFVIGAIKLSLVAFYWRLFGHTRSMRILLCIAAALSLAWVVSLFFVMLLQCAPISRFWDKTSNQGCRINIKLMLLLNVIPHLLTDIYLICLPMIYVGSRLISSKSQKATLIGLFALGFFVILAPIVRLKLAADMDVTYRNLTWYFTDYVIWCGVEINIAIVAGCLPSLRPILARILPTSILPAWAKSSKSVGLGLPGPDVRFIHKNDKIILRSDTSSTSSRGPVQVVPDVAADRGDHLRGKSGDNFLAEREVLLA